MAANASVRAYGVRNAQGDPLTIDTVMYGASLTKTVAALVRGDGLSAAARAEMVKPSLRIGTAHQFPAFAPYLPEAEQRPDLAAGLGVIVFDGPQGRGFYKGGHDSCSSCSATLASPSTGSTGTGRVRRDAGESVAMPSIPSDVRASDRRRDSPQTRQR